MAAEGAATPTSGTLAGRPPAPASAAGRPVRAAWLWLFGLGAFLALTFPVLDPGLQLYFRDTVRLYYPVKRFIAERLLAGELPLWYPWNAAGQSLLGQLSPGLFHPFTLLYLVLPFDLAFKLNHLLALPLAGIGAWLLSRRLGASPVAALVGAVGYGGSGFLVSMAGSNLPYAVGPAMVPWAVAGLLWLAERPGPGRLLAASAALASCVWAGDPQSGYLAALIGGGYLSARSLFGAGDPAWPAIPAGPGTGLPSAVRWRLRRAGRSAGLLAAWGACALLLAGPSLVPVLPSLARSVRATGIPAAERARFSVQPLRMLGYLLPQAFDSTIDLAPGESTWASSFLFDVFSTGDAQGFADSITIGPPICLLALAALRAGRRGRFLLLLALLLGLLSGGDTLGVEAVVQRALPGLSSFRYAEKFAAPCALLLSLAAALGAEVALGRGRASALRHSLLAFGLTGLLASAFCASHLARSSLEGWLVSADSGHKPWIGQLLAGAFSSSLLLATGLAAGLGLALALGARSGRVAAVAAWAVVAVCLCASLTWASRLLYTVPVELLRDPPPLAAELVRRAGPSAGRWRLYADVPASLSPPGPPTGDPHLRLMAGQLDALQPQAAALYRIEGADDYFSLDDQRYNAILLGAAPQALALLDVRFVVAVPNQGSERAGRAIGFLPAPGKLLLRENPPGPRVTAYTAAIVVPGLGHLLEALRERPPGQQEGALLLQEDAVLAAGLPQVAAPPKAGGQPPSILRVVRPRPERIEIESRSDVPLLVAYSEHFDPGWSATVDGRPSPVGAVDGLILGVATPAGQHQIVLTFLPRGLGPAVAGSFGGALLLLAAELLRARRDKKCQSGDSSRQCSSLLGLPTG